MPSGTVAPEHQGAALKHVRAIHDFADRDLQVLIILHGIMSMHVSKLLVLFGLIYWHAQILSPSIYKGPTCGGFSICPNHTRLMYYTTGVL